MQMNAKVCGNYLSFLKNILTDKHKQTYVVDIQLINKFVSLDINHYYTNN